MSSSLSSLAGISSSRAALGVGSTDATASSMAKAAFGLSTDEFFSLFLAQLQNQDPTQPVDDKEMVAQLAQFTMIQTLNDVSAALNGSRLAESAALIGKQVTGFTEAGSSVTGIVERVEQTADGFWLVVGDDRIAPESVATVSTPPVPPT